MPGGAQSRGHRLPLNPRQRLPVPESRLVGRGPVVVYPRGTMGGALQYPDWVAPLRATGQVVRLANAVGSNVDNLRIRPVAVGSGPARQPCAGTVELVHPRSATAHAVSSPRRASSTSPTARAGVHSYQRRSLGRSAAREVLGSGIRPRVHVNSYSPSTSRHTGGVRHHAALPGAPTRRMSGACPPRTQGPAIRSPSHGPPTASTASSKG